jgi:hypothetical protein
LPTTARTTSGIFPALPLNMYRHLAARLMSWSNPRKRKSLRACTMIGRLPTAAAPMTMPVSAFSMAGASNTRAGPKRLAASVVDPKMPDG